MIRYYVLFENVALLPDLGVLLPLSRARFESQSSRESCPIILGAITYQARTHMHHSIQSETHFNSPDISGGGRRSRRSFAYETPVAWYNYGTYIKAEYYLRPAISLALGEKGGRSTLPNAREVCLVEL